MIIMNSNNNKIMKKWVGFVFAIAVATAVLAVPAFAAVNGSISPASGTYAQGGTITVDVILTPSTAYTLYGIDAYVYYDENIVDESKITVTDYGLGSWYTSSVTVDAGSNRVKFSKGAGVGGTSGLTISSATSLYRISFPIKSTAPTGNTTVTVGSPTGSFFSIYNNAWTNVTGTRTPGTFTIVANQAPTAPTLVSPSNGATDVSRTPTFDWSDSSDPDGTGISSYTLTIDNNNDFGSPVVTQSGIAVSNYTLATNLDYSTTYYWKVTVNDGEGSTATSSTNSFITLAAPASPPNITGSTPSSPYVWDSIVLAGTNFTGTGTTNAPTGCSVEVKCQGWPTYKKIPETVTEDWLFWWQNDSITFLIPASIEGTYAVAGTASIKVSAPGGSSTFNVYLKPTLYSAAPSSGRSGDSVTITGNAFGTAAGTVKVYFGSPAAYSSPSTVANTTMTVTVPTAAVVGSTRITVEVNSQTSYEAFTVTGDEGNNAPTASAVSVSASEDTAVSVTMAGADADGDALTYSIVTSPAHGTLGTIASNQVTYTPNANYNGSDSFTYRVYDGTDYSSAATVSVTVNAVNDTPQASNVSRSALQETAVSVTLAATDADGDALTYSIVASPLHGTLGTIAGNSVTYTPAVGYTGIDTFTYRAYDGTSYSNTATVTITVSTTVNNAPTASAVSAFTTAGTAVQIALSATDADGDALTYSIVTHPVHGTLGTIAGNSVTYTPVSGYVGSDSFTYKANDGTDDSNTATVTITVSEIPAVTPAISTVSPLSAYVGQTLIISGSNFGASGEVTVGGVSAIVTNWTNTAITASIPSGVSAGSNSLVIISSNGYGSSSVTVASGTIMLDDFEGGSVGDWYPELSGYYAFDNGITPDNATIASQGPSASAAYEGSRGMKIQYSYSDPSGKAWGGGWGATLANTLNLSGMNRIKFYLKWDGSANDYSVTLSDSDGTAVKAVMSSSGLSSSSFNPITIATAEFSYAPESSTGEAVDKIFDWSAVTHYNFVYDTKNTSANYQYIDSVQATYIDASVPTLAVSPTSATFVAYGDSVTSPISNTNTITVSNTSANSGNMSYEVSTASNWITLSKSSGTVTAGGVDTFNVSINLINAPTAVGIHYATIEVMASGAQNSPQTISIAFDLRSVTGPIITSLSSNLAPAGTRIFLYGYAFGTTQGVSQVKFSKDGAATNANIVSWSDTTLEAEVPFSLAEGTYNIEIYKLTIVAEGIDVASKSDAVAFRVTAASSVGLATIYPTPFNPANGETVTIQFNPGIVTNIGVYIYDATARVMLHRTLTGVTQTTWDGKDSSGAIVGDGVYLVMIVNEDTKALLAKGKALVVKR